MTNEKTRILDKKMTLAHIKTLVEKNETKDLLIDNGRSRRY